MDKQQYDIPATNIVAVRMAGVFCQSFVRATRAGYGSAAEIEEWD